MKKGWTASKNSMTKTCEKAYTFIPIKKNYVTTRWKLKEIFETENMRNSDRFNFVEMKIEKTINTFLS